MSLTAFYVLFRIGELSTKSTRFTCSVVQFHDLQISSSEGEPRTAKITITDCKHKSDPRPFDILISRDHFVPFSRLKPFLITGSFAVIDVALFFVILISHLLLCIN